MTREQKLEIVRNYRAYSSAFLIKVWPFLGQASNVYEALEDFTLDQSASFSQIVQVLDILTHEFRE